MTIQDLFDEADALVPNFYTTEQKLKWFNDLEYRIYMELFTEFYPGELPDYTDHSDATETPQVNDAYGRDMYLHYYTRTYSSNREHYWRI